MESIPSRREILIAGALTGNLSDGERQEFDQARAVDPTIDVELGEFREIIGRLDRAEVVWREESLPAGLEARILAETVLADPPRNGDDVPASPSQP